MAEWLNRILLEKVKSMLCEVKLPKLLWGESLVTVVHHNNRILSNAIDFKTSFRVWFFEPSGLKHLRVFGYKAFSYQNVGKLEPRVLSDLFLGYYQIKGYKLVHKVKSSFKFIRDFNFKEDEMPDFLKSQFV